MYLYTFVVGQVCIYSHDSQLYTRNKSNCVYLLICVRIP